MSVDNSVLRGKWTYGDIIQENVVVRTGRFCSIGRGVRAVGILGHHTEWVTTYPFGTLWNMPEIDNPVVESHEIVIGNDVWIGAYAVLLGGAKLGDGCVVGAGSVVKKEVPPYSVVIGNPAEIIRKRFSDDIITRLLEIKWWDWPEDKIKEHVPFLCDSNIEKFINKAY
jgi:acetyltransferase-like isoleucine patch superfamily enzyme